jgi:hypothetical protein
MATGDQTDFIGRLRAVLPTSWFPLTASGATSATPVLDGVLTGLANIAAYVYALIQYVKLQSRLLTCTDVFLDIASQDFFGTTLPRAVSESDSSFRSRILLNLFKPSGTRAAIIAGITQLTGNAPTIVESARPADTGARGGGSIGIGYCQAGAYGNVAANNQMFISIKRGNGVTDAAIYSAVNTLIAAGTVAWVQLHN